jgi:ribosome-associated heat shock protein Hsp15
VRINGQRVDGASRPVRLGDVVTVALDRSVRVLKVAAFAERRGSAASVQALAEDLTPVPELTAGPPPPAAAGLRQPGTGRPTKRDRRTIAHMRGEDEF